MRKTGIVIIGFLLVLSLIGTTNRTYGVENYCATCGLGRTTTRYDCAGFVYWKRVRFYETGYHRAYIQYVSRTCSHSPVIWEGSSTGTWFQAGRTVDGATSYVMNQMDFSGLPKLQPGQAAAILKVIKPNDTQPPLSLLQAQQMALDELRNIKAAEIQRWWHIHASLFSHAK